LAQVLGPVQDHAGVNHPDLIVGIGTSDDAGVFTLGNGRALIQTVDIFTPVVDSPRDWGRIAAANALSDIYAMGATPVTALQYLAWPRDLLSFDLASEVIAGGLDVMVEAKCTVVGGHSIDGPEPTFGFAVTGIADTESIVTNAGARPGDVLVLTKPLGMGIITTAIKNGVCPPEVEANAVEQMASLNDIASLALRPNHASAATDVTGYGLLGHLREMCLASGVGATIDVDSVPIIPGARDLLAQKMWAGGSQRNLRSVEPDIDTERDVDEWKPLVDAQTSGGLLVALPEESVVGYIAAVPGAVQVGHVTPEMPIRVA
jgi:selenide, water dikinase